MLLLNRFLVVDENLGSSNRARSAADPHNNNEDCKLPPKHHPLMQLTIQNRKNKTPFVFNTLLCCEASTSPKNELQALMIY